MPNNVQIIPYTSLPSIDGNLNINSNTSHSHSNSNSNNSNSNRNSIKSANE